MNSGPSLDDFRGMRELFREEARTILDRLRLRLPELQGQLPDDLGLADVVADGVALKGSGALVDLPVVSRAGVLIVRAAKLAAERAPHDLAAATGIVEALQASLGVLERLVDACLDGDDAAQDSLLGEALGHFDPDDRSILRTITDGEDGTAAEPAVARVRSETLDRIATALTDLLIADTQLGGVECEIDALAASLTGAGEPTAIVGEVAATLATRAVPARALARAAAELHRQIRELGASATPLESLVLLHVGDTRYAVPADDVESVVPATRVVRPDGTGHALLSVDGQQLPALDLGACLGDDAPATLATAAILHGGGRRFALLVTRVEGPRLMVLRPLDALLATHPLSRDATLGPAGDVVLVLRAGALLDVLDGRIDLPRESTQPAMRD